MRSGISELLSTCEKSLRAEDLFILLNKYKFLEPPSKLPYNFKEEYKYNIKYKTSFFETMLTSWLFIKSILIDFYKDRPPGFFIEAGAMDGESFSNTLYLEKNLSWTGLLVEGNKNNYKILKEKNRKSWTSPLYLATKSCPHQEISTTYSHSKYKESFWRARASSRLLKNKTIYSDKELDEEILTSFEKALCVPVHYMLDSLNISKVDFFSLDVERLELDVLKHFPFDRIKVDLWVIEHVTPVIAYSSDLNATSFTNTSYTRHLLENINFVRFMESKGYYLFDILCRVIADYIFVRINSELFKELNVPSQFLQRRKICLKKPLAKTGWKSLEKLRDKTHWPSLKFKQNI